MIVLYVYLFSLLLAFTFSLPTLHQQHYDERKSFRGREDRTELLRRQQQEHRLLMSVILLWPAMLALFLANLGKELVLETFGYDRSCATSFLDTLLLEPIRVRVCR